jgi:hypothetical protein
MLKPTTPYVLFNEEFKVFARALEMLKMPLGYASNFGKHIWNKKFGAFKSHDYHVLMYVAHPTIGFIGVAKTVGEDGNDAGVQSISKNMHKSVQSIQVPILRDRCCRDHGTL